MKKHIRAFVSLLCAAALALGCASCGGAAQSTGKSGGTAGVTHITVWTYYNGDQLESFNKLWTSSTRPLAAKRASGWKVPARAA